MELKYGLWPKHDLSTWAMLAINTQLFSFMEKYTGYIDISFYLAIS